MAAGTQYLLARYVFEDLGYRRYGSEMRCSKPLLEKAERLGFTYEGCFRQAVVYTDWLSIIDQEWPAIKERSAWLDPRNFDATVNKSNL